MTAEKMLRVLRWLEVCGVKPRSIWIGHIAGELTLEVQGQLWCNLHDWIIARGFVYVNDIDAYIYRPIKRRRNANS